MSLNEKPTLDPADDEAALRALFERLLTTWAGGDAAAYGALFTEDADYVAFDGVNQRGREAIVRAHRPLFEKYLKGSRLIGELTSLRLLAPDVALLHASGGTVLRGQTAPEPARASVQSLVAVKLGHSWLFTSFHNTRLRPLAGFREVLLWNATDGLWRLLGPKEQPVVGGV